MPINTTWKNKEDPEEEKNQTVINNTAVQTQEMDNTPASQVNTSAQSETETPAEAYRNNLINAGKKAAEERKANIDRYGIELPDNVYAQLNKGMMASEVPQDTAYKYATAIKYSQILDTSFDEAYAQMDDMNAALWNDGKTRDEKKKFESVCDMFRVGNNNVKLGQLGHEIMQAERDGDEKMLKILNEQVQALNDDSALCQENIPHSWIMDGLYAGAQSAPYTGYSSLAAMFGNFIIPGSGVAAAFATSAYLTQGQEYIDMRTAGIRPQIARNVSFVDGGIQGLVESTLGEVAGMAGGVAANMGKKVIGNAVRDTVVDKVAGSLAKKFHFSAGKKLLAAWGTRYVMNLAEEGTEEVLQQAAGDISKNVAIGAENKAREEDLQAALDQVRSDLTPTLEEEIRKEYPNLDEMSFNEIVKDSMDQFIGGVAGAVVLGIAPTALHAPVDIKRYLAVKDAAQTIESEEAFKKFVKEDEKAKTVFDNIAEDQRDSIIDQIWKEGQNEADLIKKEDIKESKDLGDHAENAPVDETGERIEKASEYRDDKGELYTEYDESYGETKNGKTTARFMAGDPSRSHSLEENGNRYGYIDYTVDGDTITIDNFRMTPGRENLSKEFYSMFAEENAGMDIKWDPKYETNSNLKEELIAENPRGKENGLNYFSSGEDVSENKEYIKLARQIKENAPNITNEQAAAEIGIIRAASRAQGLSTEDFINNTFENGQLVTSQATPGIIQGEAALNQGKTEENKVSVLGATELQRSGKSILYVAKNGDFNTLVHETGHILENYLTEDERATVLKEFGGDKNGKWDVNTSEKFADALVDYLRSGKTNNKGMESIFEKAAKFIADIFRGFQGRVELSPELKAVYDSLLQDDGSGLSRAMYAVSQNEKRTTGKENYNNRVKSEQAQSENTETKENDNVRESEESQTEENVRGTTEEKQNVTTETAETKEEVKSATDKIVNEVDATTDEKAHDSINESAVNNAENTAPYDLFQIISEKSLPIIRKEAINKQLTSDLEKAKAMYSSQEWQFKDKGDLMRRIKRATGWEIFNDKWVHEFDERSYNIDTKFINGLLSLSQEQLQYAQEQGMFNNRSALSDIVLNANELYEYFPGLKNVSIQFINNASYKWRGATDGRGITFNLANIKSAEGVLGFRGVLTHEIQHIIQGLEGDSPFHRQALVGKAVAYDIGSLDDKINEVNSEYEARYIQQRVEEINREILLTDKTENKPLYQIIGEKGALELDRASEVTTRQDNLSIAESMEKENKDALTIRLATGWERGADGLWKYEIDDSKFKFDFSGKTADWEADHPRITELADRINKAFEEGRDLDLTEDELKEWDNLTTEENDWATSRNNKNDPANRTVRLSWILHAPELYKAYPELKDVEIFDRKPVTTDGYTNYGFTDTKSITLDLSSKDEKMLQSNLLHEIQHIIQSKEGFATGGNQEQFILTDKEPSKLQRSLAALRDLTKDEILNFKESKTWKFISEKVPKFLTKKIDGELTLENVMDNFVKNINSGIETIEDVYNDIQVAARLYDSYYYQTADITKNIVNNRLNIAQEAFNKAPDELQTKFREMNRAIIAQDFDKLEELENSLSDEDRTLWDDYYAKQSDAQQANEDKVIVKPFEAYQRLSGEVESRNVEARRELSAEERLNTLLSKTEDIAQRDQIVMFQTLKAMSEVENAQQENDVRSVYENTKDWMKAPNGEDTNLTEKQWLQVRTPNFKAWFGDWENDPIHSSKILDENGEPMVLYHGSDQKFDEFDMSKGRANMDIQGSFFSPFDIDAQGYGGNLYTVYLNIRNPVDGGHAYKALNTFAGQNGAGVKARELLKSQGYDGVNGYDEEFIIFNPNQVKSAVDNNGEFSTENNKIRFQTDYDFNKSVDDETALNIIEDFKKDLPESHNKAVEEFNNAPYDTVTKTISFNGRTYTGTYKEDSDRKYNKDAYSKEERISTLLASKGFDITLVKEDNTKPGKKPDAIINGLIVDFKEVTGTSKNALGSNYQNALGKNNVNGAVLLLVNDLTDEEAYDRLRNKTKPSHNGLAIIYHTDRDSIQIVDMKKLRAARNEAALIGRAPGIKSELPTNNINSPSQNVNEQNSDNNKLLLQTDEELLNDASQFNTWEEFRDSYMFDFGPQFEDETYHDKVPSNADDEWYKNTWERAQKIAQTNEYNDDYVKEVRGTTEENETLKDQQWYDMMESDPSKLDDFLRAIADAAISINENQQPQDQEELDMLNHREALKSRYAKELRHGFWATGTLKARPTKSGEEVPLTLKERKTLMSLMRNSKRDYRDLYSDFMFDKEWKVADGSTTSDKLRARLQSPDEEFENKTPELRRAIADRLDFEDLKEELKDGSMKMDLGEVQKLADGYETEIGLLNDKIEALKKQNETDEIISLKKEAQLEKLNEELKKKQQQKTYLNNIRDIKLRLIKAVNKKVDFKNIDYDSGRQVIAIQALFQPKLKKFIDKFLNSEGEYLRDAYSKYRTDFSYRSKLQNIASAANSRNLRQALKIMDLKAFDKWTEDDMELVASCLPRTDWIAELSLDKLIQDREGSLQLDFQSQEVQDMLKEILPENLYAKLSQTDVKDWTLEDMEDLVNVTNEIRQRGQMELRAREELRLTRASEYRRKIESALKSKGLVINPGDSDAEKKRKQKAIDKFKSEQLPKILGTGSAIKGTLSSQNEKRQSKLSRILNGYSDANIRRVARILDNGKDGINTTLLYLREDECFNAEQRAITHRTANITKAMEDNKIELSQLFDKVHVNFADGSADFTVDELMYFAAANDDPSSYAAVTYGNMYDESVKSQYRESGDVEGYMKIAEARMTRVLDAANKLFNEKPELKNFMEAIEKDYGEQYERMNKVSIAEFNSPVWRVEHYVPLNRLESSGDTNANRVKQDLLGMSGAPGNNYVDKGMTKKRIEISPVNQKPVMTGLYSTWAESLNRTEHFLAYAGYVRDLNRVYKNRDSGRLRQYMENRYGKAMTEYIDDYINEVANPEGQQAQTDLDRFAHILRGKTAPAYLAWKMSGVIKQLCTSPWPYLQYMSPLEYAASCFDIIKSRGAMDEAIKNKSAFMNSRKFDPIVDLIDEQKDKASNPLSHALNSFESLGMQGLEWADWACVAPGWLAAYRKEKARLSSKAEQNKRVEAKRKELESYRDVEGDEWIEDHAQAAKLTEGDIETLAVRKADDIVRMTQPSNRLTDLSPMFKQRGPGSEISRIFLQFTTSLNVIWQNLRYDLPVAVRNKQAKMIVGMVASYMMAGVMMGLITEGDGTDDKDDEETKKEKRARQLAYYSMTQFTDSVPLIGSIVSQGVKQAVTGEKNYSQGFSDMFPLVTKASTGVMQIQKGDYEKAMDNFMQAAGLSLGLPVSGLKEAEALTGIGDKDGEFNFYPQALVGRRPEKKK